MTTVKIITTVQIIATVKTVTPVTKIITNFTVWSKSSCDFFGSDIRSGSAKNCMNKCFANVQCTHYTFNGDINLCYLKFGYVTANNVTQYNSTNVVCGILFYSYL